MVFNNKKSKERTIAFFKSKQFLLLVFSIIISFVYYGFIYSRVKHAMAASAMAFKIESEAIQLKEEEEVLMFDPYEILQVKPNANRRKINKAFVSLAKEAATANDRDDHSVNIPSLRSLHHAYRALTDEDAKWNFLIHGHPDGPAPRNTNIPQPVRVHFLHPFINCLDLGSIVFIITLITFSAVLIKISPARQSRSADLLIEKLRAPFLYYGGLAPKDIHAVIIDSSVATIEANAFRGCTSLQSVEIPFTVKEVHKSAFRDCISLQTVTFLSRPEVITCECTDFCEQVSMSMSIETLPSSSSSSSSSSSIRQLPNTQTDTNTSTVSSPSPLENISPLSHNHTSANGSVQYSPETDKPITTIGSSLFRGCRSLRIVTLPSTLKLIPKSTFKGCSALTSIVPPLLPFLEKVGHEAFDGCASLRSVKLLPTVKKVGVCAFHSCKSLEIAEVLSPKTDIGRHAFDNCPKLTFLPLGYSDTKGRSVRPEICAHNVNVRGISVNDKDREYEEYQGQHRHTIMMV